ncbi:peptidoglycan-binding domain-containing protein [Microbacterium oxydans]|uniref:Putative peptidoglycan binding domain protein n=1 Tax=Microbacterium oxydans TaxID=82380 RepID=A0A0F0L7Y7_9MICO|nr:peptidoglycan-binding domain-containing protein [Microbacterium oxydans]KJL29243.1 putative peptidoglycan binding domain protein [Microbacterium oxydans]
MENAPSNDRATAKPRRRSFIVTTILAVLAAGAVGWAASSILTPADDPLEAADFTYVTVQSGEVGSTITLNTVAKWTPVPAGSNRASGVVTEVSIEPGAEVMPGDVLFRVNEHPVVIGQGDVPAYRSIDVDTKGADVAQLQSMLTALGLYGGAVDGTAGPRTIEAIRAWQKTLDVEQTGVVDVADIIYVPQLPTRVSLDDEVITRGNLVAGGEPVVRALSTSPVFRVPVTEAQAATMPTGTRVEITSPEGDVWIASAGKQVVDSQSGSIDIYLDGESICGGDCAQIPVSGEALLSSVIVTAEEVSGLVIPSAALVTSADGQFAVIDRSGDRLNVTVIASARGMSVVEGVAEGIDVRVPGTGPAQ